MSPKFRDGRTWLLVSVLFYAIGLSVGFFAVMIAGMGVSGSGCGRECMNRSSSLAVVAMSFFGPSFAASLTSIGVVWTCQFPPLESWRCVGITALNLLILLIGGGSFVFLWGFL